MSYLSHPKIAKTLSDSAFRSFSTPGFKTQSLEKPLHLGNFYLTINLKAKTSVMKKYVRRAWENDILITVWEE